MSGHTPGPWRLEKRDGVVTSQAESKVSRDDFPWKVVVPAPPFALGATGALIENEANARLIVAAPELLEALRTLADYPIDEFAIEDKPDTHRLFGANDWTLTAGDVRAARAAIAKATQP